MSETGGGVPETRPISLNLRGFSPRLRESARRQAGARGMTLTEYVERLILMHETAQKDMILSRPRPVRKLLEEHGLEPVKP